MALFRKVGLATRMAGVSFFRAFDEASEGPACGAVAGLAVRGQRGALGWSVVAGVRRGAGAESRAVVGLRLGVGSTGTQRGLETMQLFPPCGVQRWRSAIFFRSVPAVLLGRLCHNFHSAW